MNGRVYDPLIARFVSPDPYIQDPEHGQSYNRYTYVWNNPTNLTDPTGFVGEGTVDTPKGNDSCDIKCQELRKKTEECAQKGRLSCGISGDTGYAKGSADKSGTPPPAASSVNTNRDDIVREAMLASPNRFVSESAVCVGNEKTCIVAGTATLGGGWLFGTKLGQVALALFGFGAEVQGMADGVPSGRGIAGVEAKAATSSAASIAANNLAKSAEKEIVANATHIFAKGRFDSIGSQQEVTAGIVDSVRNSAGRLVEGNNTVTTLINNQSVTVRVRLQEGALSNINAFPGTSTRTLGNVIDLR